MHITARAKYMFFFEIWSQCGGSWASALMFEEKRNSHEKLDKSKKAWLTFDQMEDFYKSTAAARAVRDKKLKDPALNRPHPEVPHCLEAMQYHITVEEGSVDMLRDIVSRGTRFEAALGEEAAAHLLPPHLADVALQAPQAVATAVLPEEKHNKARL